MLKSIVQSNFRNSGQMKIHVSYKLIEPIWQHRTLDGEMNDKSVHLKIENSEFKYTGVGKISIEKSLSPDNLFSVNIYIYDYGRMFGGESIIISLDSEGYDCIQPENSHPNMDYELFINPSTVHWLKEKA